MCVYYIYHTNLHICIHMHVMFLSFSLSLSSPSLSIFFFLLLFSFDRVVCTYSLGYTCMRVCSCVCACVCAFSGMQHILSISIPLCICVYYYCVPSLYQLDVSPCLSYIDCLSFSFINTACMWHGECVHARTDMCLSTGR